MHEKELAKCIVILGDDHLSRLTNMHNLAETYRQQRKYIEVGEIHKDVLARHKIIFGAD